MQGKEKNTVQCVIFLILAESKNIFLIYETVSI